MILAVVLVTAWLLLGLLVALAVGKAFASGDPDSEFSKKRAQRADAEAAARAAEALKRATLS